MTKERHRGTHLGYLEYHADVLEETQQELITDLQQIRKDCNGKERYKKEQKRLLDFHNAVADRIEQITDQIDGVNEHEDEQTLDRAKEIKESAYNTHQEDSKGHSENIAFETAKEYDMNE